MSAVLPITIERAAAGTIERGLRTVAYEAPGALAGPYVFDDDPGSSRSADATGDYATRSATLYVQGTTGPGLASAPLSKGDRLTIRGSQWIVDSLGDWSELADALRVRLVAVAEPA